MFIFLNPFRICLIQIGLKVSNWIQKVSSHPENQTKFYFIHLFFTLQDLESLGMWQATTLKINLAPRFGKARVTSRLKASRVLPPLKNFQLNCMLACLESWGNFSWATFAFVSFVSTLVSWAKVEILHRLVQLVLHIFWTIACIMSWVFAIETYDNFEFFTCLLWTTCCIMA